MDAGRNVGARHASPLRRQRDGRRTAGAVLLAGFSRQMLDEAIRLYLEEAYGDATPPESVRRRLRLPDAETLAELAADDLFERTPADAPPEACSRIRLRLGSRAYPHVKLGLDRLPDTDDWVLVADCHDHMLLAAAHDAERDAVETIVRQNADLKARIERRWTEAGLPTFERYVRRRLAARAQTDGPTQA